MIKKLSVLKNASFSYETANDFYLHLEKIENQLSDLIASSSSIAEESEESNYIEKILRPKLERVLNLLSKAKE